MLVTIYMSKYEQTILQNCSELNWPYPNGPTRRNGLNNVNDAERVIVCVCVCGLGNMLWPCWTRLSLPRPDLTVLWHSNGAHVSSGTGTHTFANHWRRRWWLQCGERHKHPNHKYWHIPINTLRTALASIASASDAWRMAFAAKVKGFVCFWMVAVATWTHDGMCIRITYHLAAAAATTPSHRAEHVFQLMGFGRYMYIDIYA